MLKKVLAVAAASAISPAFAGIYFNVENNGSIKASNWLGSNTDFHVGYEGQVSNGTTSYYIQGGLNVDSPDSMSSKRNFSAKAGGSVKASDNIDVYGELSILTDRVNSYGTKVGLKIGL